jgi:hypothetical protein
MNIEFMLNPDMQLNYKIDTQLDFSVKPTNYYLMELKCKRILMLPAVKAWLMQFKDFLASNQALCYSTTVMSVGLGIHLTIQDCVPVHEGIVVYRGRRLQA